MASLGIHTKSVSAKAKNYQLQAIASRLLPGERVSWCSRQAKAPVIEIRRSVDTVSGVQGSAYYHGLAVCGSAWVCPVCSSRINAGRRKELERATKAGFSSFIVTLTLQHDRRDRLDELISALTLAWRKTRAGRAWQRIEEKYQIVASASALEVTYSKENGFHPHRHVLFFSKLPQSEINTEEIEQELSSRWIAMLAKGEAYGSEYYALKVTRGYASYLSKWSAGNELTSSQGKQAGDGHLTMWQVLEQASSDAQMGMVFKEYAKATKGRRLLTWSKNARHVLGLDVEELSDEQIAEQEPEQSIVLLEIPLDMWRAICKHELRGEVLELAETQGSEAVIQLLERIKKHGDIS